jgi:NADH dehydrogenase
VGDAAAFRHDPRYPKVLPGVAPVAMQQGRYVAKAIGADLKQRERTSFKYLDKGQLAVIGRGHGVADIGPVHIGGLLAWLAWIFIHILYLIGFANRIVVMFRWALSYVTFERGARLITHEWRPDEV